jgi:hypothetical protein
MSLKNIRSNIAAEAGYHPDSSSDDLVYLNNQINQIAYEVYTAQDLVGSLFEIIAFFTDFTEKLISTPWYVGEIRAGKYYDTPRTITLRDIRPRFGTDGWTVQLFDFREVGTSTFAISNTEYSTLTFSLPEGEVETEDIIITIVGETPVASQVEEQIVLIAGQNSVSSANNWIGAPKVIEKNRTNLFDITITNINSLELGIIPNGELRSLYAIWQVQDDSLISILTTNSMEILYKEKYRQLVNDYDEFLNGRYDEVIIWKFLDEYWSKQDGKKDLAEGAALKWMSKLAGVNKNKSKGKKIELQTVPNKFYGLFDSTYYRAGKSGYN